MAIFLSKYLDEHNPLFSPPQTRSSKATVVAIGDGDTTTVIGANNAQRRVPIAGIDAPETRQSFGSASGKRLCELVAEDSSAMFLLPVGLVANPGHSL
jgi:endonuclease YncB( thermonuclease family)